MRHTFSSELSHDEPTSWAVQYMLLWVGLSEVRHLLYVVIETLRLGVLEERQSLPTLGVLEERQSLPTLGVLEERQSLPTLEVLEERQLLPTLGVLEERQSHYQH